MIPAYDKLYLREAQMKLAKILDLLVNGLDYPLPKAWRWFLESTLARRMESGDCAIVAGRSGTEITMAILEEHGVYVEKIDQGISWERSEEYWTGWALAYYQWASGLSFAEIEESISIEKIRNMYMPYHEMDITYFCDKMDEYCKKNFFKEI